MTAGCVIEGSRQRRCCDRNEKENRQEKENGVEMMLFGGGRGGSARRYIVWYHPRRKQKPCGKPDLELPRSLLPNPTSASRMEHAKQNSTRRLAGLGGAYSVSWI